MRDASTLLTVSTLTNQIKNSLESSFINVKIEGEISNFKKHSSGHLYFDLKDSQAKIAAVMFRRGAQSLTLLPKEGDSVIVSASVNVYAPHGRYQLVVQSLEFVGTGALLLKLEELKRSVKARGWFEPEHKQRLPLFPKTIGVVTSPTGAVIQDILHVLERRHKGFHLILNPVRVQGKEAAKEIAQAIKEFNEHKLADVLIVGRGGGSLEDLWPFNEEIVAEAIFHSKIPIVCAVGHETDFCIADFVADVRAPTPSAAAEIVGAEKSEKLKFLQKSRQTIRYSLEQLLCRHKLRLAAMQKHPIYANPLLMLSGPEQRLDELQTRLDQCVPKEIEAKKEKLAQLVRGLQSVDPKNVLKRGYGILFAKKSKSVIVSSQNLQKGDLVNAILADGQRELKVVDDG